MRHEAKETRRAALLALGVALAWPGAASAADDAAIWAQIDAWKPIAEAITIDGDASDWGAIPAFPDARDDSGGDPTRDIRSVRIAPTDDALAVLIETEGTAAPGGFPFWIRFDFMGFAFADVELALDPIANDGLSWFEEGGCSLAPDPCSMDWDESELAISGSTVEIRVPYDELDAVLPASMQGKLSGSIARPWVRVWTRAIDYLPSYTEVDHGAAVGSFRLVTTPYPLDPALPPGGDPFTALPTPLPGLWFVGQGPMTQGTHTGLWGYDLHRTDNALNPERPVGSSALADNFSFDLPIVAPVAGSVESHEDSHPDHAPYAPGPATDPNFVYLEIPGDLALLFSHTTPGSIPFVDDDPVAAGATLGRVGNSGSPWSWPHLHYGAEELDNGFASHPLGISDGLIGLNPGVEDPWRREIAAWGIREGFFVVPEPAGTLLLAAGAALLALLARLGRCEGFPDERSADHQHAAAGLRKRRE